MAHANAHGVFIGREDDREPPLIVHLTRMAGALTLVAGVIMLIAASPAIGVAIVLLSALYFALAEIIGYLALIARHLRPGDQSFFRDAADDLEREIDAA
ncbi:MAG: hypothetical protein JWO45_622 [Spartobacteria bacterium]|nr:hypothetical protein [Spartobacteria bacterium]